MVCGGVKSVDYAERRIGADFESALSNGGLLLWVYDCSVMGGFLSLETGF